MTTVVPYPGLNLAGPRERLRSRAGILGGLLMAYVALLAYQFETSAGMNFAPGDCFLLLVLPLAAGCLIYRSRAWSIWHYAIPLVFVIGSLTAALRFGKLARYELLNKDAGLLLPFLSYIAITSVVTEWDDVRRILRVFVIGVVIENVAAVAAFGVAYFTGHTNPFVRYDGLRLSGMLLDPNAYGGLLVAALVVSEGASWGPQPLFKRPLLLFTRVTLGLGILFTFSRSAWLALTVSLILLSIFRAGVTFRLLFSALLGLPVLLLIMGPHFIPIFERMAKRPQQVQDRFDLIDAALDMFTQYPFLGGGLGAFRLAAGEIAHNTAMWFLADFGLIGVAVLLGFLGWFFWKGWQAYSLVPLVARPLVLALLLAHAAMLGLAMGIEAFYQRHWWLVFALLASSYSLAVRPQSVPYRLR